MPRRGSARLCARPGKGPAGDVARASAHKLEDEARSRGIEVAHVGDAPAAPVERTAELSELLSCLFETGKEGHGPHRAP